MAGVGNDRGPHRTSGTSRHHEQLKLRYHHLRNRFRHDVYRVQEKMAIYCDGGAWNHCHRLRAACGHRPREGGNPPFLPAEPNPGVEKPGGVSEVRWISGPSGTVRHRFRRPSRKGTGTEYPEVKLPSGAAERYDLRGDLRGAGTFRRGSRDIHVPVHAVQIFSHRRKCAGSIWCNAGDRCSGTYRDPGRLEHCRCYECDS